MNRARRMRFAVAALGLGLAAPACRKSPGPPVLVARLAGALGDAGAPSRRVRVLDPHNVFSETVAAPGPDVHPWVELLRNQFRKRLLPSDGPALDATDVSNTANGDLAAMRYRLADVCVRSLVPFLFAHAAGDVRGVRAFAPRLSHAKPVVDAASADAAAVVLRAARVELASTLERLSAQSGRDGGVLPDESLVDEFLRVEGAADDLLTVVERAQSGAATVGDCGAGDAGVAAADAGEEEGEGEDRPRAFKPESEGEGDSLADFACVSPDDAAIVLAAAVASDVEELSDERAQEPVIRALRAVVEAGRAARTGDAGR